MDEDDLSERAVVQQPYPEDRDESQRGSNACAEKAGPSELHSTAVSSPIEELPSRDVPITVGGASSRFTNSDDDYDAFDDPFVRRREVYMSDDSEFLLDDCPLCENSKETARIATAKSANLVNQANELRSKLKEQDQLGERMAQMENYIEGMLMKEQATEQNLQSKIAETEELKRRNDHLESVVTKLKECIQLSEGHMRAATELKSKYDRSVELLQALQEKNDAQTEMISKLTKVGLKQKEALEIGNKKRETIQTKVLDSNRQLNLFRRHMPKFYRLLKEFSSLGDPEQLSYHAKRDYIAFKTPEMRLQLLGAKMADEHSNADGADDDFDDDLIESVENMFTESAPRGSRSMLDELNMSDDSNAVERSASRNKQFRKVAAPPEAESSNNITRGRGRFRGRGRGGRGRSTGETSKHVLDRQPPNYDTMMSPTPRGAITADSNDELHANFLEKRKKTHDPGAGGSTAASSTTVHGKKTQSVREYQQEQLKKKTVHERALELKEEQQKQREQQKPQQKQQTRVESSSESSSAESSDEDSSSSSGENVAADDVGVDDLSSIFPVADSSTVDVTASVSKESVAAKDASSMDGGISAQSHQNEKQDNKPTSSMRRIRTESEIEEKRRIQSELTSKSLRELSLEMTPSPDSSPVRTKRPEFLEEHIESRDLVDGTSASTKTLPAECDVATADTNDELHVEIQEKHRKSRISFAEANSSATMSPMKDPVAIAETDEELHAEVSEPRRKSRVSIAGPSSSTATSATKRDVVTANISDEFHGEVVEMRTKSRVSSAGASSSIKMSATKRVVVVSKTKDELHAEVVEKRTVSRHAVAGSHSSTLMSPTKRGVITAETNDELHAKFMEKRTMSRETGGEASTSTTSTTIHGKKTQTVREYQQEQLKKKTVHERALELREEQQKQKEQQKQQPRRQQQQQQQEDSSSESSSDDSSDEESSSSSGDNAAVDDVGVDDISTNIPDTVSSSLPDAVNADATVSKESIAAKDALSTDSGISIQPHQSEKLTDDFGVADLSMDFSADTSSSTENVISVVCKEPVTAKDALSTASEISVLADQRKLTPDFAVEDISMNIADNASPTVNVVPTANKESVVAEDALPVPSGIFVQPHLSRKQDSKPTSSMRRPRRESEIEEKRRKQRELASKSLRELSLEMTPSPISSPVKAKPESSVPNLNIDDAILVTASSRDRVSNMSKSATESCSQPKVVDPALSENLEERRRKMVAAISSAPVAKSSGSLSAKLQRLRGIVKKSAKTVDKTPTPARQKQQVPVTTPKTPAASAKPAKAITSTVSEGEQAPAKRGIKRKTAVIAAMANPQPVAKRRLSERQGSSANTMKSTALESLSTSSLLLTFLDYAKSQDSVEKIMNSATEEVLESIQGIPINETVQLMINNVLEIGGDTWPIVCNYANQVVKQFKGNAHEDKWMEICRNILGNRTEEVYASFITKILTELSRRRRGLDKAALCRLSRIMIYSFLVICSEEGIDDAKKAVYFEESVARARQMLELIAFNFRDAFIRCCCFVVLAAENELCEKLFSGSTSSSVSRQFESMMRIEMVEHKDEASVFFKLWKLKKNAPLHVDAVEKLNVNVSTMRSWWMDELYKLKELVTTDENAIVVIASGKESKKRLQYSLEMTKAIRFCLYYVAPHRQIPPDERIVWIQDQFEHIARRLDSIYGNEEIFEQQAKEVSIFEDLTQKRSRSPLSLKEAHEIAAILKVVVAAIVDSVLASAKQRETAQTKQSQQYIALKCEQLSCYYNGVENCAESEANVIAKAAITEALDSLQCLTRTAITGTQMWSAFAHARTVEREMEDREESIEREEGEALDNDSDDDDELEIDEDEL